MRIGDPRQAQRLATKLPPRCLAEQRKLGQSLQRYVAIKPLVARPKYDSHSSSANLFDDAVMAKDLANAGSRGRHSPDTRLAKYKGQQSA
jgi:hypothetical protein